jgi:CheY-like chemotaxis protein
MKTILIAEDYEANRELIRELLNLGGYRVLEASNGEEAFAKMMESKPDLVLADIQMPTLDGYGLVQRIRNTPALAGTRVIALTAYAMDGDREKVLASGFDGYITKPIDMKMLYAQLTRFLETPERGAAAS